MIGKVKALTLALVAVCALSAVSASGASAAEFHIAGMGTVTLDGTQLTTTAFQIPEGELKCPNAKFNVHTVYNSSNVEVETTFQTGTVKVEEPINAGHPALPETLTCQFAGFPTLLHMNGCDFKVHTTATTALQATIECPVNQQITAEVTLGGVKKCTIHIPAQGELGGITAANNANDVDLTAAVQGIKYQTTIGTGVGACVNTTAGIDGKFNGKITVQGTAGGALSKLQIS